MNAHTYTHSHTTLFPVLWPKWNASLILHRLIVDCYYLIGKNVMLTNITSANEWTFEWIVAAATATATHKTVATNNKNNYHNEKACKAISIWICHVLVRLHKCKSRVIYFAFHCIDHTWQQHRNNIPQIAENTFSVCGFCHRHLIHRHHRLRHYCCGCVLRWSHVKQLMFIYHGSANSARVCVCVCIFHFDRVRSILSRYERKLRWNCGIWEWNE